VNFSEIKGKLYKIGAPELPDSCIPLGVDVKDHKTKLVAVNPNRKCVWCMKCCQLSILHSPGTC
jgi:polyribonucleotide 5'-hydroxyl-kinase